MPQIKVNEKALAHLSRGLYRSPASALRELISNAWDANTHVVRIDTNYPFFYQLAIEDDGVGFTRRDFEQLMEGGVGNSTKRPQKLKLVNDRPVIGRLGIGLLGIAQICGQFTITSVTKSGEGFKANIQLYDLLKEKLDENDDKLVERENEKISMVHVGTYEFDEEFKPSQVRPGTRIITKDNHPAFISAFQKSLKLKKFKALPRKWPDIQKIICNKNIRSLQELGDYWRLLWELSVASPVKYYSEDDIPDGLIKAEQKKLQNYDFKVYLDNVELFKPIRLKDNPGGYTTVEIKPTRFKVYGVDLSFSGYIVVQEGSQLRPDEFRGILIRIKNVGIGYYDPSLLDYSINEGPRSRWLTGEIFVSDGLEDALNIDRDSFNKFHPEYRKLQSHIHGLLQNKVFPTVYKRIDRRSKERQSIKISERKEALQGILKSQYKEIKKIDVEVDQNNEISYPVATFSDKNLLIQLPSSEKMKTKKSQKQLASYILAIYEISILQDSNDDKRKMFSDLLTGLLSKW